MTGKEYVKRHFSEAFINAVNPDILAHLEDAFEDGKKDAGEIISEVYRIRFTQGYYPKMGDLCYWDPHMKNRPIGFGCQDYTSYEGALKATKTKMFIDETSKPYDPNVPYKWVVEKVTARQFKETVDHN